MSNKSIKGLRDLNVYQNLYHAMITVHTKIVISLSKDEKYDLADQLKRASKAGPALIAEGFAKRYQKCQWRKYLNDAIGESNEMIHHISVCIDVYIRYVDIKLCQETIDLYDIRCRQLVRLGQVCKNHHEDG